jgi:CRISPR/Cas system-associated endoribonuclease Cas2
MASCTNAISSLYLLLYDINCPTKATEESKNIKITEFNLWQYSFLDFSLKTIATIKAKAKTKSKEKNSGFMCMIFEEITADIIKHNMAVKRGLFSRMFIFEYESMHQ